MMAFKFKSFCNTLIQCNRLNNLQIPRLNFSSNKVFYSGKCYVNKDPAEAFFSFKVQKILKRITGFNIEKLHEKDPLPLKSELVFATDEELQERLDSAERHARILLEMPPVVQLKMGNIEILSIDQCIQGSIQHKHIFTDISEDISEKERIVVVREPIGILRTGDMDEKFRMNLIYAPRDNRFYKLVPLFQDPTLLQDALSRDEHWFVLDFACHQLEPTYEKYHEVTSAVYDHILASEKFDLLFSTRHFGPMAFYLAWNHKLEALLVHFIDKDQISDASAIMNLYNIIHNKEELEITLDSTIDECFEVLKKSDDLLREKTLGRVKMALQRYNERRRDQQSEATIAQ